MKFFGKAKLVNISDAISQAILEENISSAEFYKILKEIEKYHKLKREIQSQSKGKVRQIT